MTGNEQALEDGDLNKEFSDLEPDAVELLEKGGPKDDYSDDAKDYSEKVNQRIGKEVAKTKKANALTGEANRERDIYRERFEEGQQKIAAMAKANLERENTLFKADIESLPEKAALALEEGRSEDYVELDGRVTAARIGLSKNETELANHEETHAAPPARDNEPQPGEGGKPMSPAAKDWMTRNKHWIDEDPERFARAQNIAKQLENREGYSVGDEGLYEEIDSRLGEYKEAPGGNESDDPPPKRQQSNVNVPNGGTPPPRPNKQRLSAEDLRLMRTVNLDPNNAEHRRAYAEGKG